jgi:hypothetical protein
MIADGEEVGWTKKTTAKKVWASSNTRCSAVFISGFFRLSKASSNKLCAKNVYTKNITSLLIL